MKYTIIDHDKGARFIPQDYDTLEEAQQRLAGVLRKAAGNYSVVIVQVDDDGDFHELASEPESTPATTEQPARSRQPRRQ